MLQRRAVVKGHVLNQLNVFRPLNMLEPSAKCKSPGSNPFDTIRHDYFPEILATIKSAIRNNFHTFFDYYCCPCIPLLFRMYHRALPAVVPLRSIVIHYSLLNHVFLQRNYGRIFSEEYESNRMQSSIRSVFHGSNKTYRVEKIGRSRSDTRVRIVSMTKHLCFSQKVRVRVRKGGKRKIQSHLRLPAIGFGFSSSFSHSLCVRVFNVSRY